MTITMISVREKLFRCFECQTIKDYSYTNQLCSGYIFKNDIIYHRLVKDERVSKMYIG